VARVTLRDTYGLGVLVWSPLSSGGLSGAVRRGQEITTHRANFPPTRCDLDFPSGDVLDAMVAPGNDVAPDEKIGTRPLVTDSSLRRR
jgi:aryl-alcohol dehydrogenase-like predicted oxidoreductase